MDQAALQVLVEEAVARALAKVRIPLLRPGTVADPVGPMILVDGDTAPVMIPSLIGAVAVGQRVMVLFHPPAGAVVMGTITT